MTTAFQGRTGTAPEEGIKAPCVASTTADITLSGEQTIDGVAVVAGDRVLVRSQTDTTENGIYDASAGAWTRSTDFNAGNDVVNGLLILEANNSFIYQSVFSGTYSPGTTAITFIAQPYISHIPNPSDAHAASAISNTPAGTIEATEVQAAINELDTEKTAASDLSSNTNGLGASLAGLEDAQLFYTGLNVERALAEIKTKAFGSKALAVLETPIVGGVYFVGGADGGWFKGISGAGLADNGGAYCGTQFIPTGGDGSIAWIRGDYGALNIKWFGAKGDGNDSGVGTDDVVAFQAAHAYLDSIGGGDIRLRGEIYVFGSTLDWANNVRMLAIGGKTKIIAKSGSDVQLVAMPGRAASVESLNVSMEGIIFDGNKANAAGVSALSAVTGDPVVRFRAINCIFKNALGYGLGFQSYDALPADGESQEIYLEDCVFENCGDGVGGDEFDGLDVKDCDLLTLINCIARNNILDGFDFRGRQLANYLHLPEIRSS